MKKVMALVMAAAFALSLAACAPQTAEKVRVKCPKCGYEFEAPVGIDG